MLRPLKNRIRAVILYLSFLSFMSLTADHINGGEISYKQLSGKTYRFYLKVYRDCNECTFNTSNCPVITKLNLYGGSELSSEIKRGEIGLTFLDKKDVSPNCEGTASSCAGGNIGFGTELWTWYGDVDLGGYGIGVCHFTVDALIENRKSAYTNQSEAFHIEAMIDLCSVNENNSAVFNAKPIQFAIVNQSQSYNLLAHDMDGDSLSYHLVSAQKSRGTSINYGLGYSATKPLDVLCNTNCDYEPDVWPVKGFGINSFTGDCSFTARDPNKVGVLAIMVKEWRAVSGTMVLVGQTTRDIVLNTVTGVNNSTRITLFKDEIFACDYGQIQQDFYVNDKPVGTKEDSVKLDIFVSSGSSGIYSSRINGDNAFDAFVSYTPINKNQDYDLLTVITNDNYCPLVNMSYKTMIVRHRPKPILKHKINNDTCNLISVKSLQAQDSDINEFWRLLDSNFNEIETRIGRQAKIKVEVAGKYFIEHIGINTISGCESRVLDSIIVKPYSLLSGVIPWESDYCSGADFKLRATALGGIGPFSYFWNNELRGDELNLNILKDTLIKVFITDSRGCNYSYTQTVGVYTKTRIITRDTGYCYVPNNKVELNKQVSLFPVLDRKLYYRVLNGVGSSQGSIYEIQNTGIADIEVKVSDANGCFYYDTFGVNIVAVPETGITSQISICQNDGLQNLDKLTGNKIDNGRWDGQIIKVTNRKFFYPSGKAGLELFVFKGNYGGCEFKDSTLAMIKKADSIFFDIPRVYHTCSKSNAFNIKAIPSGGEWFNTNGVNGLVIPSLRAATNQNSSVSYKVQGSSGCLSRDSVNIIVSPEMIFKAANKMELCVNGEALLKFDIDNIIKPIEFWHNGTLNLRRIYDKSFILNSSYLGDSISNQILNIKAKALPGCDDTFHRIEVKIKPIPVVQISSGLLEGCAPFDFSAAIQLQNNVFPDQYSWSYDGRVIGKNQSFRHTFNDFGDVRLQLVASKGGCASKASYLDLKINETITANFITNPPIPVVSQDYPYLTFNDISMGVSSYTQLWDIDGTSERFFTTAWPRVFYDKDTGYYKASLAITTDKGCKSERFVNVYVGPRFYFHIPNTFSPNLDGPVLNEMFKPVGDILTDYTFTIYNSLKNRIFETHDYLKGWDGNTNEGLAQAGTYIWILSGRNDKGVLIEEKGLVNLIR